MRVIAGQYKGKTLVVPRGHDVRPTIARLKESYFNIVDSEIENARFLDLCAGSGAMGIEALSRGADYVIFLERNKKAVQSIRSNLLRCGIRQQFDLIHGDLFQELPRLTARKEGFDLIYFDPPYFGDIYERGLQQIADGGLLNENGLLAAHHFHKTEIPSQVEGLSRVRQTRHGDAQLSFYQTADL